MIVRQVIEWVVRDPDDTMTDERVHEYAVDAVMREFKDYSESRGTLMSVIEIQITGR